MFSWRFWFLNCVTVGSSDVSAAQIASIFSLTGSNICWSDVFCSGGFNENWPDTTVPICGHKICQTQLYLSVVTKLARRNCDYLWSQNHTKTTTIRSFRLLSDALSHEGNPHYQLRWQVWKKILDIYSRSSVAYYHDIHITLSIEIAVGRGNHSFQIVST